jgi:hemolysin activation/secretion protein
MRIAGCGLAWVAGLSLLACGARGQAPTTTTKPEAAATAESNLPLAGTVPVKSFAYAGNTRFTDAQLDAAVAEILKRNGGNLSLDDLEEARQRLTLLYVNAGYINSGAILPDQTVDKDAGVVKFEIVEGKLSQLNVRGTTRLRRGYLTDRIWHDPGRPLDALELRNNLELLRQNPNVKSVNAELKPGERPGESVLDVAVLETTPWQIGIQFDNNRSPSVGAERLSFVASHTDVLGLSDALNVRWGLTKGHLTEAEFAELDDVNVGYSIPVTRWDTTLQLAFENSDSPVVEEPFAELDIRSRTEGYSVGVRQPIYRTVSTEVALSLTLSRRQNDSFLAGEPFSFSPGAINGRETVTALRFGQELVTRTPEYALALRSTFSFGLDTLEATVRGDGLPDSQYWAWLGQAQYVRRLRNDWQLILRGTAQLTDQALLPLEQFSLGGVDTVRGYRENQLVRDEAVAATIELRVPVVRKNDRSVLDLAVFVDAGWAHNNPIPGLDRLSDQFISSAGVGLIWNPCSNFNFTIYYGHPFEHFEQTADDLQDLGVHFSMIATWP